MFGTYIKYFFMTVCSFYLFYKLLHLSISKREIIIIVVFSTFVQIPNYYIHDCAPFMFIPFMFISFYILVLYFFKTNFNFAFVTSVLSYGLSYFTFFLSTVLLAPLCFQFIKQTAHQDTLFTITHLFIGVLQLLLASVPFRFSRLKKGMPFILQKSSNTAGVIIGIIILIAASFWGINKKNDFLIALSIICVAACGLFLIIWWRRRLTRTYLEKLKLKEINELQEENLKLKRENQELSKIIHKDNKLIPAMEMAVQEFIACCSKESPDRGMMQKSMVLLQELHTLSAERKGILSAYETQTVLLPPTGSVRIDSVLRYMQQKALAHDITFHFAVNCSLKYMINNLIDEDSLATLIADLTENSIIASKEQQTRNILLNLSIENKTYSLYIFDSGILFDPDVIIHLGKTRFTTHADTGGSGIGLMSILEIAQKHNASFCIDETVNDALYTKKISIIFDSLNQICIMSSRAELHNIAPFRPDINFK